MVPIALVAFAAETFRRDRTGIIRDQQKNYIGVICALRHSKCFNCKIVFLYSLSIFNPRIFNYEITRGPVLVMLCPTFQVPNRVLICKPKVVFVFSSDSRLSVYVSSGIKFFSNSTAPHPNERLNGFQLVLNRLIWFTLHISVCM